MRGLPPSKAYHPRHATVFGSMIGFNSYPNLGGSRPNFDDFAALIERQTRSPTS